MLDTASLTDILQYLEEKDGHITVNRVMETASLYDGKAPPASPIDAPQGLSEVPGDLERLQDGLMPTWSQLVTQKEMR